MGLSRRRRGCPCQIREELAFLRAPNLKEEDHISLKVQWSNPKKLETYSLSIVVSVAVGMLLLVKWGVVEESS